MIELLKQKIAHLKTNTERYNFLREYFQLLTLNLIDEHSFFRQLAFMGGTSLRVIYDLERYSEDLDFNVLTKNSINFSMLVHKLQRAFQLLNLDTEIIEKDRRAVAIAKIKIHSILYQLGISKIKNQKIYIKLEIDKNPPEGFKTESHFINKEFLFNVRSLDLASLFAGKLLAIIGRKYPKGRDYYDLIWFLSKRITPNLDYFNSGLKQQNIPYQCHRKSEVKALLKDTIETVDFYHIAADVRPFLINPQQIRFFNQETFLSLINQLD